MKNIRKKILSMICLASLIVGSMAMGIQTKAEPSHEPLDDTLQTITFSNFGANVPGTYAYDSAKPNNLQVNSGTINLENKMLRGTITFSGNDTMGMYIGNSAATNNSIKWLKLFYNSTKDSGTTGLWLEIAGKEVIITQEKAGVPLVNTAVDFGLSYQRVDSNNDGKKDQLKLGIWINGNLYDKQYVYVDGFEDSSAKYTNYVEKAAIYVSRSKPGVSVTLADVLVKKEEKLEEITFSNFGVNVAGTYAYDSEKPGNLQANSEIVNLENKMLRGTITFSGNDTMGMYIGNSAATNNSIKWLKLFYNSTKDSGTTGLWLEIAGKEVIITQEKAGVPLVNTAVDFGLSYQRVDSNNDGNKDQLKLGIWINGKLYDDQYVFVDGFEDTSAKYTNYVEKAAIYVSRSKPGVSVTLANAIAKLDENLEEITFRDFGVTGRTYVPGNAFAVGNYGETLAGKVFSGNVTFSEKRSELRIGGIADAWGGLGIVSGLAKRAGDLEVRVDGKIHTITKEIAEEDALVGVKLNLKISYQMVDTDGDNQEDQLKIGIWINNKLYNNSYIYVKDYEKYLVGKMGIYTEGEGAYLVVQSEGVSDVPEVMDPSLEKITFRDFGATGRTYVPGNAFAVGKYEDTLENKVFSGDVIFSGVRSDLWIGGETDAWGGLAVVGGYSKNAEYLTLKVGGKNYKLWPDVANTTLVGEKFNLKLTYQTIDTDGDDVKDQLKLGVWINDVLYGNEYFYVKDYAKYLIGNMGVYTDGEGAYLTIRSEGVSDVPEVLDPSLKTITFRDFGVTGRTYVPGNAFPVGTYNETLENKVFSGTVEFSGVRSDLWIGGEKDAWGGIAVISGFSKNAPYLTLKIGAKNYKLWPDVAGTTLVGTKFNLKLSYQTIDKDGDGTKDQLKLGAWINGVLYGNDYFYVDNYAKYLVGNMGIYTNGEGAYLTIQSDGVSDEEQVLDPTLKKITFSDFNVPEKTYVYGDRFAIGFYKESLENKVFCGNVTFSPKRTDLWIGGEKDAWGGIGIMSGFTKNAPYLTLKLGRQYYKLWPEVAGTTLVGEKFNLKLSYQVVDMDGDGNKDHLQLGVWINDKLYNNEYFYAEDYARYLVGNMGIYKEGEGSYLTVESDAWWKTYTPGSRTVTTPHTGDMTNYHIYISLMIMSLVTLSILSGTRVCKRRKMQVM